MSDKPVFSTDDKQSTASRKQKNRVSFAKGLGPIKVRLEKKGRGGKEVTVLFDLPMEENEAKLLKRELQSFLACGATIKDSCIELRGDVRQRLVAYMKEKKSIEVVKAGG